MDGNAIPTRGRAKELKKKTKMNYRKEEKLTSHSRSSKLPVY